MSEWKEYRIEDIALDSPHAMATGPFGSAISSKFFQEEGVPVIRGGNLSADVTDRMSDDGLVFVSEEKASEFKRSVVRPGDLIFTCWGTINQVGLITEELIYSEYIISNKQMKLTVDPEKADPLFIYYLFSSPLKQAEILNNGIGAAVPGFNLGQLKGHIVFLPPVDEQKEIASILNSFDRKIRHNSQTNQTLEHIAQAIFKSWFVDFEPTRAKIAAKEEWAKRSMTATDGGYDENAGAIFVERAAMAAISGKSLEELDQLEVQGRTNAADAGSAGAASTHCLEQLKTTAALFPDALVDSELGEIPVGWVASTLGDHFNVVMGQSPKGDTYNEDGEGMRFFQGRRDFGFRYPTPRVYTTEPKRLAQAGDTLISVRAPVGDRNMANQECCLGRGVAGIRHKSGACSFTYAFIGHIESSLSDSGSDGTVFSSINKKELGAVTYVAPNQSLLSYFESLIESIDQRIEVNSKEIESLEGLRDSLLPKLLSGDLNIDSEVAA